jgi:hypothetical protein
MNCGAPAPTPFIDLGLQPNGNHFILEFEFSTEPRFPFRMAVCETCWQVQIEEFPPVELMFSNHPYITGVNMPVVDHFHRMADRTIALFALKPGATVIDIGANDGTLLKIFRDRGMAVLGVDPGRLTGPLARANGIAMCETFWDSRSAECIRQLCVRPDLITATAVFYHIPDLHDFIEGLRKVMTPSTVFLAQCVSLRDILEKFQFDHFYHEHTMIHAVGPLQRVFEQHGMRLLHVDDYDVHGGSFALYAGLEDCEHRTLPTVARAVQQEKVSGLQNIKTYHEFTRRVEANREDLLRLLRDLQTQGKVIHALGAPLKGSTLLNYCGIGPDLVTQATEVNPFKIGRFTPGTHIPIVDEQDAGPPPNYYLLLSWNFLDFFRKKYAEFLSAGGAFILPHPEVRIVRE